MIGVTEGEEGKEETQRRIDLKMLKRMNNDNRQERNEDMKKDCNRQEVARN